MFRITQASRGLVIAIIFAFSVLFTPTAYAQFNITTTHQAELRTVLIALIQNLLAERSITTFVPEDISDRERVPLDDLDVEAVYSVINNTLKPTAETSATRSLHFEYWDTAIEIIPDSYHGRIGEFVVYDEPDNKTDAFVQSLYFDKTDVWRIAINGGTIDSPETERELFDELIIHEFTHIATLNDSEINGRISESRCDNYYVDEGCPRDDSYFQRFIDAFWSTSQLRQSEQIAELSNSEDALYDFYEEYEDEFVTDYAATNPAEDIAESFATFVVYERPVGTSVYEQKINWFYQFPELVALQIEMRTALGF